MASQYPYVVLLALAAVPAAASSPCETLEQCESVFDETRKTGDIALMNAVLRETRDRGDADWTAMHHKLIKKITTPRAEPAPIVQNFTVILRAESADRAAAATDEALGPTLERPAGGDPEAAERALELEKRAETAGDARLYVQSGAASLAAGDVGAARRVLERAAELEPGSAATQSVLARARFAEGDLDGAKDAARRALELDPRSVFARTLVGNEAALARAREKLSGLRLEFANRAGESPSPAAAAPSRSAAASAPAAAPPRGETQALLISAGRKAAIGDVAGPAGALVELARAISAEPKNAAARVLRARVLNHPKVARYDAALRDAEQALVLDPSAAAARFEKGYALLQLGQVDAALAAIEEGLALDRDHALGRLYHAMALERAGQSVRAAEEYAAAGLLDPSLGPVADEARARLSAPEAALAAAVAAPAGRPLGLALAGLGFLTALAWLAIKNRLKTSDVG